MMFIGMARRGVQAPGRPGLFALIRQTDEQRNRIVHWRTMATIDGGVEKDDQLVMPDFWDRSPLQPPESITCKTLEEFILKTEFVHRSINMFVWTMDARRHLPPDARQAWLAIFDQPA